MMRVLVVEDDSDVRAAVSEGLTEYGYKTFAVSDGADALDVLELVAPDVIVLDLLMGGMDGWTFRRAQRLRHAVADIPVVIVTGLPSFEMEDLDADAVLPKPFTMDMLTAAIDRAMNRRAPCIGGSP